MNCNITAQKLGKATGAKIILCLRLIKNYFQKTKKMSKFDVTYLQNNAFNDSALLLLTGSYNCISIFMDIVS